jgi:two-component system, cell cycle response regulator
MNQQLADKILACKSIPTLPAVAVRILELANDPSSNSRQVAECIEADPAMAARLLKTVNSSFYARRIPVATINQAVVILGLQAVKTLVLGFSLVGSMSRVRPKGFDAMKFWRRTMHASAAARLLAQKLGEHNPEEWSLATLLADLGVLILDVVEPVTYARPASLAKSHADLPSQEIAAGLPSHPEVGGFIAEHWHLPPLLTVPIRWHHTPDQCPDPDQIRSCLAVQWASLLGDFIVDAEPQHPLLALRQVSEKLGVSVADTENIIQIATGKAAEVARLFDLRIGPTAQVIDLLQRANHALSEMAIQSEQMAQQEHIRASELERQNSDLERRNRELHQLALTDSLTGLVNRAGSDRYMDAEFAHAVRTNRPLALLVIDLDDFKKLNDTFGHAAGDQMLRHVGASLKNITRDGGVAGRFGGDELVLILPGCTQSKACAVAAELSRAISAKAVLHEGKWMKVTASIGVACMEPGTVVATIADLFNAADRAVYRAKCAGRNCVQVANGKSLAA